MRKTLEERFWGKVSPEPNTGCFLWIGARSGIGGKIEYAHIVAYKWAKGPIPKGMELDHLCRTTCCVNPNHLEAVPHRVNLLRGAGTSAKNAIKKVCIRGHELSGSNVRLQKKGDGGIRRVCRTCHRERELRRYHARNG